VGQDERVATAAEIRAGLDNPVIDADGHLIEYLPLIRDLLVEDAGEAVAAGFDVVLGAGSLIRGLSPAQRRELGITRPPWWGLPAANTLDRATAMLPGLLRRRLDELGIDVAVLYPTYGLIPTALDDETLRCGLARAFNRAAAELYAGHGDRLLPVAVIPMFSPAEAVAELDHAVGALGLRVVVMGGVIPRPVAGAEGVRGARWIDTLGHDSAHDYDPVWQRCRELGVTPTFHASGFGWGSRTSTENYVYNHLGNFAAAGEATCRSLLLGGVLRRFPDVRFAFLEGGAGWALSLLHDVIGHLEKRGRTTIDHYDPNRIDRAQLAALIAEHGPPAIADRVDRLDEAVFTMLSDPDEDPAGRDEFAASALVSADDVVDVFRRQVFVGCEADDGLNPLAFDRSALPGGQPLNTLFASDIGHWDVPDIRQVLPEAWEAVEDGRMTPEDFAAFTFTNAVRLWGPETLSGTAVADAAASTA
jgi:predicted TIM-barrel fold metal-dependent hydrolase